MKDYKVDKAKFSVSFCQEVYQVVCDIPVGKVSTYGEIATLLGMPQCSRMVGRALKHRFWIKTERSLQRKKKSRSPCFARSRSLM